VDRGSSIQPTVSDAAVPNSRGVGITVGKYCLAIAVLIVISFLIIGDLPQIDLIAIVTFATAIALVPAMGGEIYSRRGKGTASTVLRSFAAQSVFAFILLSGLASLPSTAGLFGYLEPALLVLTNSIILWRAGGIITTSDKNVPTGMFIGKIGGALFLLFAFQLIAILLIVWVGYPFLYAAIAYGALSIAPLIAYSERTKSWHESGEYLLHSTARWTFAAFLIGVASALLSAPGANTYTYLVVLFLAGSVMFYVGLRIYSFGASRLNAVQDELYRKHLHELNLVTDENFDYLRAAMARFVGTGIKDDLIIALTNLLTNAGLNYDEIRIQLTMLTTYQVPEIFRLSYLSLKHSMEIEMQRRIGILQSMMGMIAAEATARAKA
jgi:hypothetical protein